MKKTKWNRVGTHQKLASAQYIYIYIYISLSINGELLEKVDEYKYLGMIFDKNLNLSLHIDKMCSKISQRAGLLEE